MEGFLNTSATLTTDLFFVLTLLFGFIAIVGAVQARRNHYSTHSKLMSVAALLNWIPVLIVMIPSWLQVLEEGQMFSELSSLTPVFHGLLGGGAQLLMTYTVVRMLWLKQLPPDNPLWLMRITFGLWMLTLVGGTAVYFVKYVL